MTKTIFYIIIARHLTGDSEVLFFNSSNERNEKFIELTQPLVSFCAANNLDEDVMETTNNDFEVTAYRFNCGENSKLDAMLNENTTWFAKGEKVINSDCTHYVAEFSEWVDETTIKFFTEKDAQAYYVDMVDVNSNILKERKINFIEVNDYTLEDEDGMTLLQISPDNVYFGYCEPTWTISINLIK